MIATETPDLDREMPYPGNPPTSAPPAQGTNPPPPTALPDPSTARPPDGPPTGDGSPPHSMPSPDSSNIREEAAVGVGRQEAEALALSVIDLELEPTVVLAEPYEAGPLRQGIASFPELQMIREPLWDSGGFGSAGRERAPVWAVVIEHDPDISVCYRTGIIANPTPRPGERWLLGVFVDATDGRTAGSSFLSREALRTVKALPTADISTKGVDGRHPTMEQADRSSVGAKPSSGDTSRAITPTTPTTPTTPSVASLDAGGGPETPPFRVGSRWIYRIRMRDDRVWASGIVTRTLRSLSPSSTGDVYAATFETISTLTRVPEVAVWAPMIRSRTPAADLDRDPVALHLRFTANGLASLAPQEAPATTAEPFAISSGWRLLWTEDVETPSGTYRDCQLLQNRPGQTGGDHRWFCPGVGLVKQESCTSSNPSSHVVVELIEVRLPRSP